jgi:hypothetical protein
MNDLRVKVMAYYNANELEEATNKWLQENPHIEVKYLEHSIGITPGLPRDLPGLLSLVVGYTENRK